MTGPVTTEALVEKLARDLAREGGWNDPDAPWTENQVIIARGGAGEPVWRDFVDDARSLLGRETFTTLLAAHQQVTAERDEDRAELARLRAEGEAKDRARDDALKAAIRAWSAKLHIPVTRMMSRELRAEFSAALARAATAREGQADA